MQRMNRWITGLALLLGLAGAHAALPIVSQQNNQCLTGSGTAQTLRLAACASTAAQSFEFTAGGTVVNGDKCLDLLTASGAAGTGVVLAACNGKASQVWKRDGDFLVSTVQNQCLRKDRTGTGFAARDTLTVDSCAYNADRKWTFTGLAAEWPARVADKPSALVAGASLTPSQLQATVNWIYAETKLDTLPFCWKKAGYDRGVGKPQTDCGGKTLKDGLCYSDCRAGYTGVGPVCWGSCPSGYTDTGALCQSNQSLSYRPGTTCTKRDGLGTCWAWSMKSCRDGYTRDTVTQTCWLKDPTISKPSYGRGAGTSPQGCTNGLVLQAGMCYDPPRSGYTCTVTGCTQQCASGTLACGAGCARNVGTCTSSITDMVVSPALALASLATGGTAGTAANGVRAAAGKARQAFELGTDAAQLALILRDSITNYMQAAEGNLAAISTPEVEQAVAAKYGKGSPNYQAIARQYALVQILAAVRDMFLELDILAVSMIDPTGVVATINAFAKPPCEQHKAIP